MLRNKRGSVLLEVIISMALVVIISGAVIGTVISSDKIASREYADFMAASELDNLLRLFIASDSEEDFDALINSYYGAEDCFVKTEEEGVVTYTIEYGSTFKPVESGKYFYTASLTVSGNVFGGTISQKDAAALCEIVSYAKGVAA